MDVDLRARAYRRRRSGRRHGATFDGCLFDVQGQNRSFEGLERSEVYLPQAGSNRGLYPNDRQAGTILNGGLCTFIPDGIQGKLNQRLGSFQR